MVKIKTIKNYKKLILAVLVVVLLISGGAFAYFQRDNSKSSQDNGNSGRGDTINYDPPSEEEKANTEKYKQDLIKGEGDNSNPQPGPGKKAVKPTITYSGQYGSVVEVGAIVSGMSEDGGRCTAKFSNAGNIVTKSVNAVKNVNSTDCPVMSADGSEFSPKGSWAVTVTYESPAASGTSDQRTVEVR